MNIWSNNLQEFCMKINVNKHKVMMISKEKQNANIKIDDNKVE